tara:strand:- start:2745 stop:3626 length:882 start_codon:yes stop_codon:yes gene_type:complete
MSLSISSVSVRNLIKEEIIKYLIERETETQKRQRMRRGKETESQKKQRQKNNRFKRPGEKVYPSHSYDTPSERHKKVFGTGSYDLLKLGRGIVSEEEIESDEEIETETESDSVQLLEKEKGKRKKRKRKPNCSPGNELHYSTKEHTPAGRKPGTFAHKGTKLKVGSSSIANDPKYSGKKDCKRGRASVRSNQERFLPDKVRRKCGRQDPSRKVKCSNVSIDEDSVKVPVEGDGITPDRHKMIIKLRRMKDQYERLKRVKNPTRKQSSDIMKLIRLIDLWNKAEKGKAFQEPDK